MLTPGPGRLAFESVRGIKPVFGRGDSEFDEISNNVNIWLKKLSGQDNVVSMRAHSFSIELASA